MSRTGAPEGRLGGRPGGRPEEPPGDESTGGAGAVRLAVWSGPRNISTAMMRAFENRPDTVVVDEPFYAAYLARTGLSHPGREEVMASQPVDPVEVARDLLAPLGPGVGLQYSKQMSHHLLAGDDLEWTARVRNVLLVRDPAEVVASYVGSREECEPEDIGLLQQEQLLDTWQRRGVTPPVLDAADVLGDPEGQLRWLCDWLGVDFTDAMLTWPPGPRDSDGVWAPHWYDAVRASTGFTPHQPRRRELTPAQRDVAEACRPAYERLRALRHRLA